MIIERPQSTYRDVLILAAIIVVTAIVYSGALHFEFTNWDDDIHVTNNPAIQMLSVESVKSLFLTTDRYMYHPLTMLTYMLEWKLSGGQPLVFHATNIILHLISIILLFFLIFRLSGKHSLSLFVTAIFALHPLQVESVAWISARKDLLSGMFMLATALSYYHWKDSGHRRMYLASIIIFICALFSKPSSVIFPLILLTLEVIEEKKITKMLLKRIFIFFLLALVFTVFIIMTSVSQSQIPMLTYSPVQRIVLIFSEIGFYLYRFVSPINLSACYSYPPVFNDILPMGIYGSALCAAALIATLLIVRKKNHVMTIGIALYGIALLPVLQIIPFNNASLVADRYVYIAIIGLSCVFWSAVEFLGSKYPTARIAGVITVLMIIGIMILSTSLRIPAWHDGISLFNDVIAKDSASAIGYGNRANAKIAKGEYSSAIEDCNMLIRLIPGEGKAYYNRGNAYSELKEPLKALADYSHAINAKFRSPHLYYNRGNQFLLLKEYDSAIVDYRTALQLLPAYPAALMQLVEIYRSQKNEYERSLYYLSEYLNYQPYDPSAFMQRARLYEKLSMFGAAMNDAAKALSLSKGIDVTDRFIIAINSDVDSINGRIAALTTALPYQNRVNRIRMFNERSKLYWSLGDTLRAQNDKIYSERAKE